MAMKITSVANVGLHRYVGFVYHPHLLNFPRNNLVGSYLSMSTPLINISHHLPPKTGVASSYLSEVYTKSDKEQKENERQFAFLSKINQAIDTGWQFWPHRVASDIINNEQRFCRIKHKMWSPQCKTMRNITGYHVLDVIYIINFLCHSATGKYKY